jgi:hypothetical protein
LNVVRPGELDRGTLTEEAIEHLTANAQIGYLLRTSNEQKDSAVSGVITNTKEITRVLDGAKNQECIIMVDGEPKVVKDVSYVNGGDRVSFLGVDWGDSKNDAMAMVDKIPIKESNIRGVKLDAVFFDEACDMPKPCIDCGFPTDQQNSQTIIDGEVRYRCDECEEKCDEGEDDCEGEGE